MKKFFYLICALLLCGGMTSCKEKPEADDSDLLLGSWSGVKEVWIEGDLKQVYSYEPGEYVITFYENGVLSQTETWDGETYTETCRYVVDGKNLRLIFDPRDYVDVQIQTLTESELVFVEEGYDEEEKYQFRGESYFVRYN